VRCRGLRGEEAVVFVVRGHEAGQVRGPKEKHLTVHACFVPRHLDPDRAAFRSTQTATLRGSLL